jgi:hypothetical protein
MTGKIAPEGAKAWRQKACSRWACCCGPRLSGAAAPRAACVLVWAVLMLFIGYFAVIGLVVFPAFRQATSIAADVCKYHPDDPTSHGNMPDDWIVEVPLRSGLQEIEGNSGREALMAAAEQPTYFDVSEFNNITASDYTEVTVPSLDDGIELSAILVNRYGTGAPVVIIVHGHGACKHKFPNMMTANMLNRNGFNALMIDLRNSGDSTDVSSGGLEYTFGLTEYRDVLGAFEYLQDEGWEASQIGVWGGSMGGSAVGIAITHEPDLGCAWLDSMMCTPA